MVIIQVKIQQLILKENKIKRLTWIVFYIFNQKNMQTDYYLESQKR